MLIGCYDLRVCPGVACDVCARNHGTSVQQRMTILLRREDEELHGQYLRKMEKLKKELDTVGPFIDVKLSFDCVISCYDLALSCVSFRVSMIVLASVSYQAGIVRWYCAVMVLRFHVPCAYRNCSHGIALSCAMCLGHPTISLAYDAF